MARELAGKRVLIVEDEYFIASDLKRAFMEEGAVVIGPVGDFERGLALAGEPLDAAVLDINLAETKSYAIADIARAEGVSCVFLTGYDEWALPAAYRAVPRISKPFSIDKVVALVDSLIAAKAGS